MLTLSVRHHNSSVPMNNTGVNLRKEKKRRCKVLFSYQPVNEDELSLEVDDVVDILEEVEEGWWKGHRMGKIGVFPSNFVEELPLVNEPDIITSSPEKHNLNNELKPKPVKGIGWGNIFQDGAVKLKPTAPVATVPTTIVHDLKDEKSMRKSPVPPPNTDAPELPPKRAREQAKVLFSYEAQNEDELTLKEGDTINIISKEIEDKGWWKGELNGRLGVFPDNFVELILPFEDLRPKKPERLDKDQNLKPVKSTVDGKNQVDGSSSSKEPSDLPKSNTSSLTRGSKIVSGEIKKAIEEKVEKFDKMAAPPLPGKKPVLPPPLKKVTTHSNYRNFGPSLGSVVPPSPTLTSSTTVIATTIANSKPLPEPEVPKSTAPAVQDIQADVDLDRVESSSEKLVHLTANRVKNPNRRPPSHVFLKGENEQPNGEIKIPKKNSVSKNLEANKNSANATNNAKESIPEVEEKVAIKNESLKSSKEPETTTSKPTIESLKRQSLLHSPVKIRSITSVADLTKTEKQPSSKSDHMAAPSAATTTTVSASIGALNTSPSDVPSASVRDKSAAITSNEYRELKQEMAELLIQFEMFKNLTNRHISELSNEVKVEKEKRLILQAEMDTLKIQLQRK
ncbi:SH3-domain kinase binding protein 1 [Chamberlinius hualienensis]